MPIVYSNLGYSGRAAYSDLNPCDGPQSKHKLQPLSNLDHPNGLSHSNPLKSTARALSASIKLSLTISLAEWNSFPSAHCLLIMLFYSIEIGHRQIQNLDPILIVVVIAS